ncbi:protein of unknown function [Xenorhabdus doucetiae]|uniref:Uncharacterized protein n=1 Tax=Xenorhabdus doucetiae TaxID=351671 RepID=A0A068QNK6_9GAMM|nr:hypothetical protein LY16_01585 [Xenorhabdus doucetiae]CDG16314.1 protein of unknown function [Xenorhabdus doucetiae]
MTYSLKLRASGYRLVYEVNDNQKKKHVGNATCFFYILNIVG